MVFHQMFEHTGVASVSELVHGEGTFYTTQSLKALTFQYRQVRRQME